jgi:NTE family protein
VLSGGGNLGAVQVGMLRALAERGIQADLVLGSSVGALNGAAYAADPTLAGIERLERTWLALRGKDDVMPSSSWLPLTAQFVRKKGGATHKNDGLRALIDSALGPLRDFESLVVPFQCVVTDIEAAEPVWFAEGPKLKEAVLASSALPAVYPPVVIDGVRYLDGAIVDDVPIGRAVQLGATEVYVLTVGALDRPWNEPKRPLDMAIQAYWILRRHRYKQVLRAVPPDVGVHVLPTGDPPSIRFDDFTRTGELMQSSHLATLAHLDAAAGVAQVPPPRAEPLVEAGVQADVPEQVASSSPPAAPTQGSAPPGEPAPEPLASREGGPVPAPDPAPWPEVPRPPAS